jgi:hypothetical protein
MADDLEGVLRQFEEKRQEAITRERDVATSRSKFRRQFMQAVHGDWARQAQELINALGTNGHGAEMTVSQEPHQEMMTIHVAPNLKGLPHTGTADFDFQVKIFPNEAMLRACFVTVTPDQPEHIGAPEPYSLEELSDGKFKAVLGHHLAALLKAAMPH